MSNTVLVQILPVHQACLMAVRTLSRLDGRAGSPDFCTALWLALCRYLSAALSAVGMCALGSRYLRPDTLVKK